MLFTDTLLKYDSATGRIIMSVTYGTSPKMEKAEVIFQSSAQQWTLIINLEQYIDHAEETQVMFTEVARPGASIVDVIPFCELALCIILSLGWHEFDKHASKTYSGVHSVFHIPCSGQEGESYDSQDGLPSF